MHSKVKFDVQISFRLFANFICQRGGGGEAAAGHHHDEHAANVSNSTELPYLSTFSPSLSPSFPCTLSHPQRRAVFRSFPLAISSCRCCCFSHLNAFQKSEKPKNLSFDVACWLPLFHMGQRSRGLHKLMTLRSGNGNGNGKRIQWTLIAACRRMRRMRSWRGW